MTPNVHVLPVTIWYSIVWLCSISNGPCCHHLRCTFDLFPTTLWVLISRCGRKLHVLFRAGRPPGPISMISKSFLNIKGPVPILIVLHYHPSKPFKIYKTTINHHEVNHHFCSLGFTSCSRPYHLKPQISALSHQLQRHFCHEDSSPASPLIKRDRDVLCGLRSSVQSTP